MVKEFKFFKEKAKKKNSEQKAASSKSSKLSTVANETGTGGTTSSKQVLKSCDVLSISGATDGSKHKSKVTGQKETKQWRDGSVSSRSSTTTSLGSSCATSSANITCDSKTVKLKTSAKNKISPNKCKESSDKHNHSCETKKNSPNKTNSQSPKVSKTKNSVSESNRSDQTKDKNNDKDKDKCPKSETKRKNKVNLIKDNPLYDEDIIDGFAILSFKCFDDIEVCLTDYH